MNQPGLAAGALAERLRRLALVDSAPLRHRIVIELFFREMSASGFCREIGGGSASRVAKHFKTLFDDDWLRLTRTASGGSRYGGLERFYRATELPVLDKETCAQLPYSVRALQSRRTFEEVFDRIRGAMVAGTFDARPERHLSWTPVPVDRRGWDKVIAAADSFFYQLFEAQAAASPRISAEGVKPILMTVALAVFESLSPGLSVVGKGDRIHAELPPADRSPISDQQRLAKVFQDPLMLKIVAELNLRPMSPSMFFRELGGPSVEELDRLFKRLVGLGFLVKVAERPGRRGRGRENLYRATGPAIFDERGWATVPRALKETYSWTTADQLAERMVEAMNAGTFDARPDAHFSWTPLRLDQQGWEWAVAGIDALFGLLFEERDRAAERLAISGEEPILMIVGLAGFESPPESAKPL